LSNQKLKSENYQQFGGINNKISPYDNTAFEFIDIRNMGFQTPGALTQRWGSTQYVTQTFPSPITGLWEFTRLDGASYILIANQSGNTFISNVAGVWAGATTGNSQGLSLTNLLNPIVEISPGLGFIHGGSTTGLNFIFASPYRAYYKGDQNNPWFPIGAGSGVWVVDIIQQVWGNADPNYVDQRTFVDHNFIASNSAFVRFNGITTYALGPIPPTVISTGSTINNAAAGVTVGFFANSLTAASFSMFASYVNDRGFESQIWPIFYFDSVDLVNNAAGMCAALVGGSFIQIWADLYTPQAYGITAVNLYGYASPTLIGNQSPENLWNPAYALLGTYPVTGATTRVPLGSLVSGFSNMLSNIGPQPDLTVNEYITQGITIFPPQQVQRININNFFPSILEIHNESLFQAGFSAIPSTVVYSDPGEPEGIRVDSNFEVRTNDGDVVTAMRSYQGRLAIYKRNSTHQLLGDNALNYDLVQVTDQSGALNKHCVTRMESPNADILLSLDRKGVFSFDGTRASPFSNKVQPFFDRMNCSAAILSACVANDKLRNQILFAFPIDGATLNNFTVVYDYLSNAWTTEDGYNPTVFNSAYDRNNTKNLFYGTPSGIINWFGPSFLSDNGAGFTCYVHSRFMSDMGNSIEKQFRRLYLNAAASGSTYVIPINFFQDYGSSKVLQTTMVLSQFQNRIDFGIPAKSLAFEMSNFQTQSVFQLTGFTIESRLQRKV
jgi:hypothetical protein